MTPEPDEIPLFTGAFLIGVGEGIGKEVLDIIENAVDIITNPTEFWESIIELVDLLKKIIFTPEGEEFARIIGSEMGKQYGDRISKLADESLIDVGRGLGKIVGPTIAGIILALISRGTYAGWRLATLFDKIPRIKHIVAKHTPEGTPGGVIAEGASKIEAPKKVEPPKKVAPPPSFEPTAHPPVGEVKIQRPPGFEPTRHPPVGPVKTRRPRGFDAGRAAPGRRVKPGTLESLEPTAHPASRKPRGKSVTRDEQLEGIDPAGRPKASSAARAEFGKLRDTYAEKLHVGPGGEVHHARELDLLDRYPNVYTQDELNAFRNMRGVPAEHKSVLHQGTLRAEWNQVYEGIDNFIAERQLSAGTPEYNKFVRDVVEKAVLKLDERYGPFMTHYGKVLK